MAMAGAGAPPPPAAKMARRDDLGVTIEAQFTVGEYKIVILSAKESTGLDTWLLREKYNIPKGAEPLLDFLPRLAPQDRLLARDARRFLFQKAPPKVIHIGGDTDPYQPDERQLRVTRAVIETLARFRHPFTIITKSNLITRDLDILGPMGQAGLARAAVAITRG